MTRLLKSLDVVDCCIGAGFVFLLIGAGLVFGIGVALLIGGSLLLLGGVAILARRAR